MKNIKSEATCTNAKGKDIITEIREPFGSGIDQPREAVAIRRVLSASLVDASAHFLRTQSHIRQTMYDDAENPDDEETLHNQSTGGHRGGQEYPRTAVQVFDASAYIFDASRNGISRSNVLSFLARSGVSLTRLRNRAAWALPVSD
jgi:hypothetical protein